ncbi:flagellar assembly protein FliW [Arthrobacter sp. LAPM80]|uniref:flagellar assembly protein FliW n=1 Tax=Arthrobacter sp. LAPM80 TaxID=3141788 RepID=UPI00398B19AA
MSRLPVPSSQLRFLSPPPGLAPLVDFTLAQLDGTPGLFSLTAQDGSVRLFVLDATLHVPHYLPQLPASGLESIGAETASALILVVVSPGATSTVNLSAPIVVNPATGACLQIILDGSDWQLRHPLGPPAS